jgi:hypothetical protein
MTWHEALVRVAVTALQAALGVIVASTSGVLDAETWQVAGTTALVALVAALHRACTVYLAAGERAEPQG